MTFDALKQAIKNLIEKRANTKNTDFEELERINNKLTKLYNIKYLMIEQLKTN